jgi:hypothetical protein
VISDPHFVGGGCIKSSQAELEVHADFNCHSKLKLDRTINLPIYVNKDWKEEYGAF